MNLELREITYLAVALRILAAVVIGGLLGLERELKNRAAGLRTYMLVCTGSCLIMLTNQFIFQAVGNIGDPVRMGAQVISGIGFLGAGTIIVTRRNQIKGLTTAAGLWTAAAVGLAIGIGFYEAAIAGALAVSLVMTLMQKLDTRMRRKSRRIEIYVEISSQLSLGAFLQQLRARNLEPEDVMRDRNAQADTNVRCYTATVKAHKAIVHSEVIQDLLAIPGVEYLEEM